MNLDKIVWPVFRLGEKEPHRENGVVYYSTEYTDLDTNERTATLRIVDDTNIEAPTLSRRRLKLLTQQVPLFPIRQAIYFLGDLLKVAKTTTWFIDSQGHLFQHKKTTRAKLVVCKIKNVFPTDGLGAVIELEGIAHRFKTTFKPDDDAQYAAVLKSGLTYIFYGLYKDKPAETWRLV
jgi:hypothetical protein